MNINLNKIGRWLRDLCFPEVLMLLLVAFIIGLGIYGLLHKPEPVEIELTVYYIDGTVMTYSNVSYNFPGDGTLRIVDREDNVTVINLDRVVRTRKEER